MVNTTTNDVAIANEDGAFMDEMIREEVLAGSRPTGRWLDAQRVHLTGRRNLTQTRLLSAIDHLIGRHACHLLHV